LPEEIYREVEQGHVSPAVPRKIGLPAHVDHKRLVRDFVAPYRNFQR
jgi:hypothetical protein